MLLASIDSAQITSLTIESLDISGAIGAILNIVGDFTSTLTSAIETELVSVVQQIDLLSIVKPLFASSAPFPVASQLPETAALVIAQQPGATRIDLDQIQGGDM